MQLFTFIYSKRTGTKAAEMPDPTPRKEKTDRMSRLLKIQDEIAMGLVKAQVGQTVRVSWRALAAARHPLRPVGQQPDRRVRRRPGWMAGMPMCTSPVPAPPSCWASWQIDQDFPERNGSIKQKEH